MELAESQISERGNERSTAISKEPSRTRMRLNRGSGLVLSGRHPVRFDYPGRELLAARGSSGRSPDAVGPYRFCYPSSAATSISTSILRYAVTGISCHDRGPDKPRVLLAALSGRTSPRDFLYLLIPGLTLIGIGLGLLGLCHLSIRLGLCIALAAAAEAGLAFVRVHSQWCPNLTEIWVILGSMFMTELGLERELRVAGKHAVPGSSEIPRNIIASELRI